MVATALKAGSLAVIHINSDDPAGVQADTISFVLLKPITAGTVIYFTDRTWTPTPDSTALNAGSFSTSGTDGTFTYTAGADLAAGTIINISTAQLAAAGINISDVGEAIYVYQGTDANTPTSFLYVAEVGDGNAALSASIVNTGLTAGIHTTSHAGDNVSYGDRGHNINISDLLVRIGNTENWSFNDNSPHVPFATTSNFFSAPDQVVFAAHPGPGGISRFYRDGANTAVFQHTAYENPANVTTQFYHPNDIVFDTVHGLFFVADSDQGNRRILQGNIADLMNPGTVPVLKVIYQNNDPTTAGGQFNGIAIDVSHSTSSGALYFVNQGNMLRVTYAHNGATTENQTPVILATLPTGVFANEIALDIASNRAWILSTATHTQAVVVPQGTPGAQYDEDSGEWYIITTTPSNNEVWQVSGLDRTDTGTAGTTVARIDLAPEVAGGTANGAHDNVGAYDLPTAKGILTSIDFHAPTNTLYFTTQQHSGGTTGTGGVYTWNAANGAVTNIYAETSSTDFAFEYIDVDPITGRIYVSNAAYSGPNGDVNGTTINNSSIFIGQVGSSTFSKFADAGNINGSAPQGLIAMNAPTLTSTAATVGVTEASSAPNSGSTLLVAPIATLNSNDDDSAGQVDQLAGAQMRIANYLSGVTHQDRLSINGNTSGTLTYGTKTITYSWDATHGVMTLSGPATFDNYENALGLIRFSTSGDNVTDYGTANTRTLAWSVYDGVLHSDEVTASVAVTGINDAPVNTPGAAMNFIEDTTGTIGQATPTVVAPVNAITGISIFDVDADPATHIMTVTLSVGAGTGTLIIRTDVAGGLTVADVVGNNSGTLVLTGTQNAINTTLAATTAAAQGSLPNGLVYTPSPHFHGAAKLTIVTNDNGGTGNDPGHSAGPASEADTDVKAINVADVNDAPIVLSGAAAQAHPAILEDTPTTAANALTVAQLVGAAFDDPHDEQHHVDDNPTGHTGDTLAGIAVVANGSTAATGQWQWYNGSAWVDIGAAALNAAKTFTATTQLRFNPVANYNGAAPSLTAHLIEAGGPAITNNGVVNLSPAGTATGGTTVYSTGTVVLSQAITAVNDTPVNTVGSAVAIIEDASGTPVTGISIADVDALPGSLMTVTLNVENGRLFIRTNVTNGIVAGDIVSQTANTIVLSATIAKINATLAEPGALTYTANANFSGADRLRVTTNDNGATGQDPGLTGLAGNEEDVDDKAITVAPVNDRPTLSGVNASLTFGENAVNATPQLLDPDVNFQDVEGNLNGGTVTLSGLLAEDRAGIRNEGTAAGQMGVSGTDVTFGNVVIGTFAGGVGNTLTVTLNAAATSAAVDALLQNFTYANVSNTPTASRTLALNVTDAAGANLVGAVRYEAVSGTSANNPFNGIDFGAFVAPATTDLDADGDLDIVITELNGAVRTFRNDGSGTFTELTATANPFNGLNVGSLPYPTFVDFDGDGDLDAVFGTISGTLAAYRNNGPATAFSALTGGANPFNGINVGSLAGPAFVDLDADGDLDIVIGVQDGPLRAFRNNGLGTAYTEITGPAYPFNGVGTQSDSRPTFIDFDRDGDLDLVLGTRGNGLSAYANNGTSTAFTQVTGAANPFNGLVTGGVSSAAYIDLDGDGDLDALVGNSDGFVRGYRNNAPAGQQIAVTVTAENDAPSGADGALTVVEDGFRDLGTTSFGFSDPDGNAFGTVTITGVTGGTLWYDANGGNHSDAIQVVLPATYTAANLAGGDKLFFRPAANSTAAGSLTFTVADTAGASSTANTLTFNVTSVNDAPEGADKTIGMLEDGRYTFTVADFGFTDAAEGHGLQEVVITTLPSAGTLFLLSFMPMPPSGIQTIKTAVVAGQAIPVSQITGGVFVYEPPQNASGIPYGSFTFQVRDNGGTANGGQNTDVTPNTMTFDVTAVNDAPTIANLAANNATWTEGSGTARLDAGVEALVGDVDSANFDGGTLSVTYTNGLPEDRYTINVAGAVSVTTDPNDTTIGTVSVSGVQIATFTFTSGGYVFTFNANATPAAVQELVRAMGYANNAGDNPTAGTRNVTWTLNDGDGTANFGNSTLVVNSTVTVNAVNDAPTAADKTVVTSEDDAFTFAWADFGFSDPKESHSPLGIVVTELPAQGSLQLNGVALVAGDLPKSVSKTDIDLGLLKFVPDADESSANYASFNFRVQDAGGTANSGVDQSAELRITIDVTPDNFAPTLELSNLGPNTTLDYTENGAAAALAPSAQLADSDSPDFNTGTLTVSYQANGEATDQLSILQTGDGPGQIDLDGANVRYGGVVIGTVADGANGTSLVVTFDSDATPAAVQALVRAIGYSSTSDAPGPMPKTVKFTITDGDGGSASATVGVSTTAVNDAPTADLPATYAATEQVAQNLKGTISVGDADSGAGTILVLLSVNHGVLDVDAGTSGASVAGSGTGAVLISGTLAQIQALLGSNATSIVSYTATGDAPPATAALSIVVNDLGNSPVVLGPELLANGSFEMVDSSTGSRDYILAAPGAYHGIHYRETGTLQGWQRGTAFDFQLITQNNSPDFETGQGDAVMDLEIGHGQNQIIYQDIAGLTAGQPLVLSFEAALPVGPATGAKLDVVWNGVVIGTITPTSTAMTAYSFVVAAAAVGTGAGGANRLEFREVGSNADAVGTHLDAVSLKAVTNAKDAADQATINITATQDAAIAQPDSVSTPENEVLNGSLFVDNGSGIDRDPDGEAVTISEVNGQAANVGATLTLTSGAKLTVNADGTFSYNPNGKFNALTDNSSGAANTSAQDSFTYRLASGNAVTVLVTVNGVAGATDQLRGDTGNDTITGTPQGNLFLLDTGGNDTAWGLGGDDTFYFGGAFTAGDTVNGGEGTDTLGLHGVYGNLVLNATSLVGVERIGLYSSTTSGQQGPFSYTITTHEGNVAAGESLFVTAAALKSDETLTFLGMAETDGAFRVQGGAGADLIVGGGGGDFLTGNGGNDYLSGRGGDDYLVGGAGQDELRGGLGSDVFRFLAASDSTVAAPDKIIDFQLGEKIDLSAIDANSKVGGEQAFTFIGNAAFTGAGQVRATYDTGTKLWSVAGDIDGDGNADFVILVSRPGEQPIVAGEFLL